MLEVMILKQIRGKKIVEWIFNWFFTAIPIIGVVVTSLLDYFADVKFFKLTYTFTGKQILISLLVFISVANIIHHKNAENRKDLEQKLDKCQDRLYNKANDIIRNIDDLKLLHKNREINEFIQKFSNGKPFIIGIQIYTYTLQHTRNITRYQINYLHGYVKPDEEENAISQMYYIIKRSTAKAFYEGYIKYVRDDNQKKLEKFLEQQINYLNKKPIERINDQDSIIYALALYSAGVLYQDQDYDVSSILIDNKKEQILKLKKRTGILQGIIENEFYRFDYLGNNDTKKERIYVTYCKTIDLVNYVFLLTFSPTEDVYLQHTATEFQEGLSMIDKID